MMIFKILFLFFIILSININALATEDFKNTNVLIEKKINKNKNQLTFERFIKEITKEYNMVEVVKFEENYYVVSSQTKKIANLSGKERINAIRSTNMITEKNFLSFVKGENIEIQEKITIITTVSNIDTKEKEEQLEKIKINSNGFIKNYKSISFQENGLYIYIIYSKI